MVFNDDLFSHLIRIVIKNWHGYDSCSLTRLRVNVKSKSFGAFYRLGLFVSSLLIDCSVMSVMFTRNISVCEQ